MKEKDQAKLLERGFSQWKPKRGGEIRVKNSQLVALLGYAILPAGALDSSPMVTTPHLEDSEV